MTCYLTKEEEQQALNLISLIIKDYDLEASLPKGWMSRGTQGDEPTYTRVVVIKGDFPGYDVLRKLSTAICNAVPVNKVCFEDAKIGFKKS